MQSRYQLLNMPKMAVILFPHSCSYLKIFSFFFLSFLHKCITSQLHILTKVKCCHHINFRVYYTLSIAFTDQFLKDFIREVKWLCKGNTVNCCVWTQNPKPFTHSFTRKRFSFNHIKHCVNFAVAHTFMHTENSQSELKMKSSLQLILCLHGCYNC